jgi:hypothetical protein
MAVYFKETEALMPHVSHEDGIRVRLHREVTIGMLAYESVHFFRLCTKKFEGLVDLTDKPLDVIKRIAIGK